MEKYIGVKIVEAEQVTLGEARERLGTKTATAKGEDQNEGYLVRYSDGYESWCPKDVFEAANRPTTGMTFGHAIEAARKGHKIARVGWNGKNMFVFLRAGRYIKDVDPGTPMGGSFESLPHFCMRAADGKCVVGWLASQTDMLADDWQIVE